MIFFPILLDLPDENAQCEGSDIVIKPLCVN